MQIESGIPLFITGIDTDIGKTIATGLMARSFRNHGINVITQKMVQTGAAAISEDILAHRQLMGMELLEVDRNGTTCPYLFEVPCSPHLAARLENREIDCQKITTATESLLKDFELVLVEGAGGLSVPLTEQTTILDYVEEMQYPLVIVTSPRLGSINHTLNSFEAIKARNLSVAGVVYNLAVSEDPRITDDSRLVIKNYIQRYNFDCPLIDIDLIQNHYDTNKFPDFLSFLGSAEERFPG